jgi:Zn finger protein HypA/HybF involved in hydrogenase expression
MQITFYCEKCGSTLQSDASLAGSAVECPQCNQPLTVPAAEIKEGTTLGGFQIERLLGKGGMGEVWAVV